MRRALLAAAACSLWLAAPPAFAEDPPAATSQEAGTASVPIERLIAGVAKRTGKTFVIDPRVRGEVLIIGKPPPDLSYEQLLSILEIYGYAAFQDAGFLRVVPDASIKTQAMPTITAKDVRPASEYVTQIVTLKNISAATLVPILRPLMPQYAGMVAYTETNSLILCDRFANVRRIEELVRILDNTPLHRVPPAGVSSGKPDSEH